MDCRPKAESMSMAYEKKKQKHSHGHLKESAKAHGAPGLTCHLEDGHPYWTRSGRPFLGTFQNIPRDWVACMFSSLVFLLCTRTLSFLCFFGFRDLEPTKFCFPGPFFFSVFSFFFMVPKRMIVGRDLF